MPDSPGRKYLICAPVVALGVALYCYVPATVNLFQVKAYIKNKPELWLLPQPLALDSRSAVMGNRLSYGRLSFDTPWGDAMVLKQWEGGAALEFQQSRSILIFGPSDNTDIARMLREMDKNGTMRETFGQEAMSSNFELKRQTLNTTPADLHFSFNPRTMARHNSYLLAKSSEASAGRTGMYEFQTKNVRGFQFGDPARSEAIIVDVYDRNDRHAMIIVATLKNAPTRLTQAEANTILSSLGEDNVPPLDAPD